MSKKRRGALALLTVLSILLTACSPIVQSPPETIKLYATFYPIYALAEIIGKGVPNLDLHCLVQPQDGCLRSYQMSDWDLYLLEYSADGVLSGGSGLESFTETLETLSESRLMLAELFYGLELYQAGNDSAAEESHYAGPNPHLYLSINGARQILESISGIMSVMDSQNAESYETNLSIALDEIDKLSDTIIQQTMVCIGRKAAVMNEALVYPAKDYGFDIVEVTERESGEMLHAQSLSDCIARMQANGAEIILIEQQAPVKLIKELESAGFSVVKLNVLSTYSEADGWQGYLDAMMSNAMSAAAACSQ